MQTTTRRMGSFSVVALATATVVLAPGRTAAEAGGDKADGPDDAAAWSCTVETLLAERRCIFETTDPPASDPASQGRENARRAASLAPRACAAAAGARAGKDDGGLTTLCQREFAQAAEDSCTLDGERPLLDLRGRFPEKARGCYEALAKVLRQTRQMAQLSAGCCRCLAAARCAVPAEQCLRELANVSPGPELARCLAAGCRDACDHIRLPDEDEPAGPAKTTKGHRFWY